MDRGRSNITCVLASGGLDSAVLLARLLRAGGRVWPVYLRCGLAWEAAELYWLRRFLRAVRSSRLLPLCVLEVPLRGAYGSHWSLTGRGVPGAHSADAAVYLPGRNVLLLSHAALAAVRRLPAEAPARAASSAAGGSAQAGGVTRLAVGTLRGNPFRDASPRFFRAMAGCLTQALGHPIRISAPLRRCSKRELVRSSSHLPLELTFSCLRPAGLKPCGRCNKCAERRKGFHAAGVADPTRYAGS